MMMAMRQDIRVRQPSGHEDVSVYRLPDASHLLLPPEVARSLETFLQLWEDSTNWERNPGTQKEVEARVSQLRELRRNIVKNVEYLLKGVRRSVLSSSAQETTSPWRSGSDSYVYLDANNKYVYKYSTQEGKPEHVQYFRHKYILLKKYLGEDLIPQSVFFLGERLPGFTKKTQAEPLSPRVHTISIQRFIPGRTFQEMTQEEKLNPEVVKALRTAHKRYVDAKKRLARDLRDNGFSTKTLDLRLEIGSISDAHELTSESFIGACESPNIIYNPETRRIYFMDFGHGRFGRQQQDAFNAIISPWK